MICNFLDMEEELFKTKERIIEISIEKDHLFDSVGELERRLYLCRKELKKVKKKYNRICKLHTQCICRNIVLYR